MRALLRFSKRNPAPAASALNTSAAIPNSGIGFVDNSQGASAAVAELSTALGDALEFIDLDGDMEEKVRKLFHAMDQEASKYENCGVSEEDAAHAMWTCTPEKAQLVSWAWECALGVYSPEYDLPRTETHQFQRSYYAPASAKGTAKALICTTVRPADDPSSTEPVLVIAVRGSASKLDHIVNANARPGTVALGQAPSKLTAHSGFLNSAEALRSVAAEQIRNHAASRTTESVGPRHVIFTGHSAGGAVASLLYLLCSSSSEHFNTIRFSCITFGAPPSVASMPANIARPKAADDGAVCLNIVNEFDFVTRADPPYLLCAANLLRSVYGLPSLQDAQPAPNETAPSDADASTPATAWPTPPQLYHHVGDLVILLTRLDGTDIKMHAITLPSSRFSTLLFCRLAVHRRACYSERVALLSKGLFNSLNRWETPSA